MAKKPIPENLCQATGCAVGVSEVGFMCGPHWMILPSSMRSNLRKLIGRGPRTETERLLVEDAISEVEITGLRVGKMS